MPENVIFEFQTPEGQILEWEGPDNTDPRMVKLKFYQSILKNPALSPQIAKSQGYNPGQAPDERSAGQVALDQTGNAIKGVASVVTGIPHMVGELAGVAKDTIMGQPMKAGQRIGNMVQGFGESLADPVRPLVTGAGPEDPSWKQAAQAAGANAGALILPEVIKGVAGKGGQGASFVARAANKITPEASRLQELANTARSFREANPIVKSLEDVSITHPVKAITSTAKAAGSVGAAVAAPALEKLAQVRAGNVPPATLNFPENDLATPPAEPVSAPMTQAAMRADEQARLTRANARPIEEAPIDQSPTPGAGPQYTSPLNEADQAWLQSLREDFVPDWSDQVRPGAAADAAELSRQTASSGVIQPPPLPELTIPEPVPNTSVLKPGSPEWTRLKAGIDPKGKIANLNTIRNLPELVKEIPEIRNTPPGAMFDKQLVNGFERAKQNLIATEQSIPRETPVATSEALKELTNLEAKYAAEMQPRAVQTIAKVREGLSELGGNVPWERFIKIKRAFFNEIKLTSMAGREAYQVFKKMSDAVSKDLTKANQSFFTTKSALENAGIDPVTGLRIMEKAPKPMVPEQGRGTFRGGAL